LESYAVVSKDAEDMFEATGRNVHTELQKKQFHKPLRVLACGDIHGRLDILESALNEMSSTGRTVDFVLAVGCFLPQFEIAAFKDYVGPSATRKLPVPVYFIDYLSDVFIEKAAKDGKGFNLPVLEGTARTPQRQCGELAPMMDPATLLMLPVTYCIRRTFKEAVISMSC